MTVAQLQASNPLTSAWVAASAGTGKTKVLTDRVLRLLLEGVPPARLLCLTFTKAAAAEMKVRVSSRLARWTKAPEDELVAELTDLLGRPPEDRHLVLARQLFARLLDTPGGIKLQTIHSFCQALLRRFPVEAGVSPHFTLMDDRSATDLMLAARDRVLTEARMSDDQLVQSDLAELALYGQDTDFADMVSDLCGETVRVAALLRRFGGIDGVVAELARVLDINPSDTVADLRSAVTAPGAFAENALRSVAGAMLSSTATDVKHGQLILAFLDAQNREAVLDSYLSAFFTSTGDCRAKLCFKDTIKLCPDAEHVLAAECARLLMFQLRLRALAVFRATSSLLRLGVLVLDSYAQAKAARAVMDYDDLVIKVRSLFLTAEARSWVLFKLDGGIDHVLVDEAQDTNPEQWDVIASLVEEFFSGTARSADTIRTVFAVGDSKQSIYGFQRADAEGFERQRGEFSAHCQQSDAPWTNVALDVSFRSVEAVLTAVDAVFAQEDAKDGVGPAEVQIRHVAHRAGQGGLVELWPLAPATPDEDSEPWSLPLRVAHKEAPDSRLAKVIAGQISAWLADGEELVAKGRPVRAGDILILVRRRTRFVDALVKALKERNIPVAGADRMMLAEHIAVMDLLALAKFIMLPDDDLVLAGLLKSPLIGFTEETLFDLCHGRDGSVWAALGRRHAESPEFEAAYGFLCEALAEAAALPVYEFFAHVLGARGGRRAFLQRLGPDAADPIEEFLNLTISYEMADVPSLQGFIQWIEAGQAEIKRDPDHAGADQVRIMTVHGAKGLQAPIVFLPDTAQIPTQSDRLLWPAYDGVPIWSPRKDTDELVAKAARALNSAEQLREYRRLLYVAMTRAEDRLYVCGWENSRSTSRDSWHSLVAEGLLSHPGIETVSRDFGNGSAGGWEGEVLRLSCAQVAPVPVAPSISTATSAMPAPPTFLLQPAPQEAMPSTPLAPSRLIAFAPAARSPFDDSDPAALRRGVLIHKLLQFLPGLPWADRASAGARFLSSPAHALELAAQQEILDETLAVITEPQFADLFGPESQAEVPIVGVAGSQAVSGQIDRLVVKPDLIRVVDFKSNRPPPATVDGVAPAYLLQMSLYRDILRQIYLGRRVECELLWTFGRPRLMALPSDLLDQHRPWAIS
jgi:ATP-dependent helicase/nuclease subunit A